MSFENLLSAYKTFRKGKRFKEDVLKFEYSYEKELFKLQDELINHAYIPLPPRKFYVYEPKKRAIEAVAVRDRVVHHALCRVIEPLFDKRLIYDTYACRRDKGTLAAIERFEAFKHKLLSGADESAICVFKADISKYFENVDHAVLLGLISEKIKDADVIWLINRILNPVRQAYPQPKGIPIGNLTSQFFANLYLNPLAYAKHGDTYRLRKGILRDFILTPA
ncbi:MAG: reverse transcriptase domain-containing protein [Candidatus Omnitrophica bacterium]|nr:reverse transcriptase domain-containing protein [Candidatus Omnitrophota bacterium]